MSKSNISKKKLKAIVFTDIVDFTKLSAEDEQKALEVIDRQRELLKPIVLEHKGEWLKEIGDGLLFSFDSSLDAVNCSIKIQQSLKNIDDFKIRIGIHQGDIFIKDGDIYGDDVNIASRVEAYAPIGGISISDKVDKDISGVSSIKTTFIGYKSLKGVSQETTIKYVSSHNLPKYKKNIFPHFSYYFSTAIGLMTLFMLTIGSIMIFLSEQDNFSQPANMFTEGDIVVLMFKEALMWFLLGYTSLSYYNGISKKSQKAMLYFSYICISIFIFDEMLQPLIAKQPGGFTFYSIFISSLVIVYLYQKVSKKVFKK